MHKHNRIRKEHIMGKAKKVQEVQMDSTDETGPAEVVIVVPTDEKGQKTVVNMSMEEVDGRGWKTKSAIIRGLSAEGYSRSAIAKFLGIKYQFVRNVLVNPLKRG